MVTIEAKPGAALRLGYTGEHLARRIRFDIGEWKQLYGEGAAVLLALREGDAAPYAVMTEEEGDGVIWNLRREDVAIAGGGECELQYLVGNVVVKEERWITTVEPSMEEPGEYPESPEQGYLEQVAAEGAAARWAAREARYRADAAENSARKAEEAAEAVLNHKPEQPDQPELDVDQVQEIVETALEAAKESGAFDGPAGPQGEKGEKGETGEAGPQGPAGPQGEKGETGEVGPQGEQGETGPAGADGHTPVKGTDYWTEADKAEIVEEVLAGMPEGGGGAQGNYIPIPEPIEYWQVPIVDGVDESGKPTSWYGVTPTLAVNGFRPNEWGEVKLPLGNSDFNINEYVPKNYLRLAGLLSDQDGSALPNIGVGVWTAAAYGDRTTVMVASGTNIAARKAEGELWEAVTLPSVSDWHEIVFVKDFFVAFSTNSIARSYDGIVWEEWTEAMEAFSYDGFSGHRSAAAGDGRFMVVLDSGAPVYFYYEWNYGWDDMGSVLMSQPDEWTSIAYGGGKFVAVSRGNKVAVWDKANGFMDEYSELSGMNGSDITYGGGVFVVVGDPACVSYSTDGLSWEWPVTLVNMNSGAMFNPTSVAYAGGCYLAVNPYEMQGVSFTVDELYNQEYLMLELNSAGVEWVSSAGGRVLVLYGPDNTLFDGQAVLYSDDARTLTPYVDAVAAAGGGGYSDWSDNDKAAVLADVLAALPIYNGEVEIT